MTEMTDQSPAVAMMTMLAGFQISQALYAAALLGIPDQLADGPEFPEAVAERIGAHAPSVRRLVRNLAGFGVFTEHTDRTFALTPLGATLTTDGSESVRDLALTWMETHYEPFGALVHTIRTGEPAAEFYYGEPFFDWLTARPGDVARFTGAMRNLTENIKQRALLAVRLDGVTQVVDVGGADGAALAAILPRSPDVTGIVFDLPHVVADAPELLARQGIADRVTCVGGDFFESVPEGDAYLLSFVLHDWSDALSTQILRNVATAGGPGARLILIEMVVPPGDSPHLSKTIDLTMLGMLTGRERNEPEWRELLRGAGYHDVVIRSTPSPLSVIEARC
jgi:hypothetical protein